MPKEKNRRGFTLTPSFGVTRQRRGGFTLIEILVVISIIGVLSSLILFSVSYVRAKARDTRRIADIRNIQTALELYKNNFGNYPDTFDKKYPPTDDDCSAWDLGVPERFNDQGGFIKKLETSGIMTKVPVEPRGFKETADYDWNKSYSGPSAGGGACERSGYKYHLYPPREGRCVGSEAQYDTSYYVLAARLETEAAAEKSPGFTCRDGTLRWTDPGTRNRILGFPYYVVGGVR